MQHAVTFRMSKYRESNSKYAHDDPKRFLCESNKVFINPKYGKPTKNSNNIHINPKFTNVHINPNFRNVHINPFFSNASASPSFQAQDETLNKKIHFNPKHFNPKFLEKIVVSNDFAQEPAKIKNTSEYSFLSNRKLIKNVSTNDSVKPISKSGTQISFLKKSKNKLIRLPSQSLNSINTLVRNTPKSKLKLSKKVPNILSLRRNITFKSVSPQNKSARYKLDRRSQKLEGSILSKTKYAIRRVRRIKTGGTQITINDSYQSTSRKRDSINKLNKSLTRKYKLYKNAAANDKLNKSKQNKKMNNSIYKKVNTSGKSNCSIKRRDPLKITNVPCPVFRKFGFCKRNEQGRCFKVHDKRQIDICKDYLNGKCTKSNCLLSHETTAAKMPICLHYLAGVCSRDNCLYPHIKHGADASVCKVFLRGYCEKAEKCKNRHVFLCPDYAKTNKCSRSNCPYPHGTRKIKSRARLTKHNATVTEPIKSEITEETDLKRYYENCSAGLLVPAEIAGNSNNSSVSIDDDDDDMCTNKRPALGILPSYIPI